MKIEKQSSRLVTPSYETKPLTPSTCTTITLSPFDRAAGSDHVPIIFAYKAPTPPNSAIDHGLRLVLSDYRVWAGRLIEDKRAVVLNDKGVRFVEATASCTLDEVPCCLGASQATRGLLHYPVPIHDRAMLEPRDLLSIEFDHLGNEYMEKRLVREFSWEGIVNRLRMQKFHSSPHFLAKLKARPSVRCPSGGGYSTYESVVSHVWQKVTRARGASVGEEEISQVGISVNLRTRLVPPIPREYFGNMVLWAFPRTTVHELLSQSLDRVAELVHAAIAQVNNRYARSFADFDSLVEREGRWGELVPTGEMESEVFCPNLEASSWLWLPFDEMDFGSGGPDVFMPSFIPYDGDVVTASQMKGKGGIDVFVCLFEAIMAVFQDIWHAIDEITRVGSLSAVGSPSLIK
ncbi:LOW QUALITY PROTEIN: agmatine hydroxycinnamoyltransferase 1 [Amborella trichopoda]|nr:LOW QUALITY PROTEIN: agmatine hydroxycinnamoyltransferase 1 [Amborella trichopoda]|eukprot:XP_006838767.3 LOW QUALITY PROTEIN: agmatine hydroxycinnamoyltransferase 1 [Amborella trichopoda]